MDSRLTSYSFPQYRKYNNGKSVFKVDSLTEMVELQRLGNRIWEHRIHAERFPEQLLIRELLEAEGPLIEHATEAEFKAWQAQTVR